MHGIRAKSQIHIRTRTTVLFGLKNTRDHINPFKVHNLPEKKRISLSFNEIKSVRSNGFTHFVPIYCSFMSVYVLYTNTHTHKWTSKRFRNENTLFFREYIFITHSRKSHKSPHIISASITILLFISDFGISSVFGQRSFYSHGKYLRYIKKKKKKKGEKDRQQFVEFVAVYIHFTFWSFRYHQGNSHLVCDWRKGSNQN